MTPYKHQELQQYLSCRIREQAGSATPLESENVLSKKFGLSRTTVRRALEELVRRGLCRRVRGKGTFACAGSALRKIALIIYDTAYVLNPVTGDLIRGIDKTLSDAGYSLDILAGNRDRIEENFSLYPQSYAGLLIGAAQLCPEVLKALFSLPIPVLTVKNYFPEFEDSAVRIDFEEAGKLAAGHLIELGCRELGGVLAFENTMIAREFLNGIRLRALESGVRLRSRDLLSFTGIDWNEREKLLDRALASPNRPRGFICFSDAYGDTLYRACRRASLTVPGDVMIVGCNHLKRAERYQPEIELTSLEIPTFELGRYAAGILLDKLNGKNPPVIKIQPRLCVAASTQGENDEKI